MMDMNEIVENTKKMKLLYIEDNATTRESTLKFLDNLFDDIIVAVAVDGVDGLDKFKNNDNIDIVMSDINMPNMNGLEMSKEIVSIQSDIPILIFSAHNEESFFMEAIKVGIEGYLLKPLDMNQFLQALGKCVEKIKLKKENIEYKTKLEEKVSIQVQEILHNKKELNLFKDDIITIFTHELKTPLNAILGYSGYINRTLQKELSDKKIEKMIDLSSKIYANSIIQENMINNILEAGKIKSGKITEFKEHHNLSSLIDPVVFNYKDAYEKETIMKVDNSIELDIDKKIFTMIFTNLYSNGLKYSNTKILVSLIKDDEYQFILTIEDDGEGILSENREKVFDMFEQTDTDVLVREKEGTGIGLYTVKHFTQLCNMSIDIDSSSLYGGAKFTLKLKRD